jgi:hypothetical protein
MIETLDKAMPFPYPKIIVARAIARPPSRSRGRHGNAVSLPRLIARKRHSLRYASPIGVNLRSKVVPDCCFTVRYRSPLGCVFKVFDPPQPPLKRGEQES